MRNVSCRKNNSVQALIACTMPYTALPTRIGKHSAVKEFVEINKQIVSAARAEKNVLHTVEESCKNDQQLSGVNVIAILHRAARLRVPLPSPVVRFLVARCGGVCDYSC